MRNRHVSRSLARIAFGLLLGCKSDFFGLPPCKDSDRGPFWARAAFRWHRSRTQRRRRSPRSSESVKPSVSSLPTLLLSDPRCPPVVFLASRTPASNGDRQIPA